MDGFEKLTDEQRKKAQGCKTPEELLELAQREGYELTDDQLEAVSGGWGDEVPCTEVEGDLYT